jgi:3-oxocholest-4-en-26-oate---CoA ligase
MAYNLADFVEHTVDAVPDRTALICGDDERTFQHLEERANRLAHHLAAQGVGRDDHVAIYSYNSLEFVEAMLAAFKLRAVPINVNYRYVEDELAYLLDNSDAVALVHQAQFTPLVAAVRPRLPLLRHAVVVDDGTGTEIDEAAVRYEDALAAASPARDFEPRSADDIYILYTGGTTGYPKGVVWRHEDVWRVLGGGIDFLTGERIEDEHQMSRQAAEAEPTVGLVLAPLMHGAAQWGTLGGLIRGTTSVLLPHFDPHAVWAAIERYGITTLSITGDAMARPLIDALREGDHDTSSLVAIASTAAVFSPVVKDQLFELLPDLFISEAVGSSESGFNGMRLVEKGKTALGEGGLINVDRGPDTIVIDERDQPVAPGEVGRMARGGNVPLEYYKDPVKSAATFITDRRRALLGAGGLRPPRARRDDDAARPGQPVHQLRRREDLPRGGRVGAQGAPEGLRRPRDRRPGRALGPAGRRRRPAPARPAGHAGGAGGPLPFEGRGVQGAARAARRRRRAAAPQRQARLPPRQGPRRGQRAGPHRRGGRRHEEPPDRDVRDRVPAVRVQPLP